MNQLLKGQWICPAVHDCSRVVAFRKTFRALQGTHVQLSITAYGIYEAELNGKRIGRFIFAPGWTNHTKRLQVQTYDISNLLQEENTLIVRVAQGWVTNSMSFSENTPYDQIPRALLADITLEKDGQKTEDYIIDDTALAYMGKKGLSIITGCSHAGICNIIEYAKRVCGDHRIAGVLGGFHLLADDAQLQKTVAYLKDCAPNSLYPCHCVSLTGKARMMAVLPVREVGVGMTLEL
jgi:metal-dependent hydrolase (beta-lactamase superfamily II)